MLVVLVMALYQATLGLPSDFILHDELKLRNDTNNLSLRLRIKLIIVRR